MTPWLKEGHCNMTVDSATTAETVIPLIDRVIATAPQSVAVAGTDGSLTYGELDRAGRPPGATPARPRRSTRRPGRAVPPSLARACRRRAGDLQGRAAYVAIDPAYPDDRIRWMLDDSGAPAVVADAGSAARLGGDGRAVATVTSGGVLLDSEHGTAGASAATPRSPTISPTSSTPRDRPDAQRARWSSTQPCQPRASGIGPRSR